MNECRASPKSTGAVCRMMSVAIVTKKAGNRNSEDNINWGFSNANLACDVCREPIGRMDSNIISELRSHPVSAHERLNSSLGWMGTWQK